jgi:guanosine-3',5'-bis(diphosphate) 3'-pyrophosphohydrolase
MKNGRGDLEFVLGAAEFAARKHRDQRRKDQGASPYINHPIAVADLLLKHGAVDDPKVIAAALLHDTIEDTDTTEEELAFEFGIKIRDIVMDVTDDKTLDKAVRKRRQIEHAAHISDTAKLIKLADKISNLRDVASCPPAEWSIDRRREYFDWAKAVIDRLRGVNGLLEAVFDEAYSLRP